MERFNRILGREEYLSGKGMENVWRPLIWLNYYTLGHAYNLGTWLEEKNFAKNNLSPIIRVAIGVFQGKSRRLKESIPETLGGSSQVDDSLTSIKKQRDEIKTNIHDEDLQKEKNKELDTQEKQINKLKKGRVGLGKVHETALAMQNQYYLHGKTLTLSQLKTYMQGNQSAVQALLFNIKTKIDQAENSLSAAQKRLYDRLYEMNKMWLEERQQLFLAGANYETIQKCRNVKRRKKQNSPKR